MILQRTAGRGADAVVDVVGGATLNRSIAATRVGGTVHVVGFVGGTTAPLDLVLTVRRAVTLRAASAGSRDALEGLVRAFEARAVRPAVDQTFARRRGARGVPPPRARRSLRQDRGHDVALPFRRPFAALPIG